MDIKFLNFLSFTAPSMTRSTFSIFRSKSGSNNTWSDRATQVRTPHPWRQKSGVKFIWAETFEWRRGKALRVKPLWKIMWGRHIYLFGISIQFHRYFITVSLQQVHQRSEIGKLLPIEPIPVFLCETEGTLVILGIDWKAKLTNESLGLNSKTWQHARNLEREPTVCFEGPGK